MINPTPQRSDRELAREQREAERMQRLAERRRIERIVKKRLEAELEKDLFACNRAEQKNTMFGECPDNIWTLLPPLSHCHDDCIVMKDALYLIVNAYDETPREILDELRARLKGRRYVMKPGQDEDESIAACVERIEFAIARISRDIRDVGPLGSLRKFSVALECSAKAFIVNLKLADYNYDAEAHRDCVSKFSADLKSLYIELLDIMRWMLNTYFTDGKEESPFLFCDPSLLIDDWGLFPSFLPQCHYPFENVEGELSEKQLQFYLDEAQKALVTFPSLPTFEALKAEYAERQNDPWMTKLPKTQPTLPFEGYIKSIHPQRGGAICNVKSSPVPASIPRTLETESLLLRDKSKGPQRLTHLKCFHCRRAVYVPYSRCSAFECCYPEAQRKINSVSYCSECFGELDAKKSRDERRYIHEHLGSERILAWNPRPDLLFLSQLTLYRDVDASRTTGQDDVSLNYYPPFQYIYPQMKLNSDNTPLHSPCFQLAFFHTNELALRSTQGRCHRLADIPLVLPRTKGNILIPRSEFPGTTASDEERNQSLCFSLISLESNYTETKNLMLVSKGIFNAIIGSEAYNRARVLYLSYSTSGCESEVFAKLRRSGDWNGSFTLAFHLLLNCRKSVKVVLLKVLDRQTGIDENLLILDTNLVFWRSIQISRAPDCKLNHELILDAERQWQRQHPDQF